VIESTPRVYVQVGRPVLPEAEEFAEPIVWRDQELRVSADRTRSRIAGVRLALLLAGLTGFVGVAVGVPLLVRRGLKPVDTLSDAVSRVSERDFRLPVGREQLTQELAPIHDRLTHSLEALKVAFEREKEAVADISHELRTPVAGLLATIDVCLRKPRTADQYRQVLEDCRGITKQLGGLVERVMTLAYLDAGHTATQAAPTDAAVLADDCAAVIRPLAEAHGLTLTADAAEPAELTTDADKLREVMLNLLHNAVEYNQPGGSVRLSVRRERDAGPVVVEVSDTGIGMTPEVKGKIFERFYRADPSRTATGVHAGLGLAIVKEYVDRLGGSISVESAPGRGSTFRVTLPG
jgi:signal transduction histidine kinase